MGIQSWFGRSVIRAAVCLLSAALAVVSATSSTPIVDLGYVIYQASLSVVSFREFSPQILLTSAQSNQSNVYYNFSNIRYAAPPLGSLRFSAPAPPLNNRSAGVQEGSYGNICPNSYTSWQIGALALNPGASNENEDCLFLDVVVPKSVYDNKSKRGPVPTLVWFYGGGFTLGSKYSAGNPTGLLDQSLDLQAGGQIWVGFNYRVNLSPNSPGISSDQRKLGAFGWLNGPTFAKSGAPNAGLYDQRMALYWVQENIHLFGGDPTQVTAIGESAGGGSILHQITAFGGVKAPFNQAIIQSPAFIPKPLKNQTEIAFEEFLAAANVSTLAEARTLDTSVLQLANKMTQAKAFYGTFTFGAFLLSPCSNYWKVLNKYILGCPILTVTKARHLTGSLFQTFRGNSSSKEISTNLLLCWRPITRTKLAGTHLPLQPHQTISPLT